jgi:hypothetical protein
MIPERLPKPMPAPPRVYWGLIVLLNLVTLGLFNAVWLLVLANWVRRVNGSTEAIRWAVINVCLLPALLLLMVIEAALGVMPNHPAMVVFHVIFRIGSLVCAFAAPLSLFRELRSDPISISLSGVMTFFFQSIYLQYHLDEYDVRGKVIPRDPVRLASGD